MASPSQNDPAEAARRQSISSQSDEESERAALLPATEQPPEEPEVERPGSTRPETRRDGETYTAVDGEEDTPESGVGTTETPEVQETASRESTPTEATGEETPAPSRWGDSFPGYGFVIVLLWMIFWPEGGSLVAPVGDVGISRFEHAGHSLEVLQNCSWADFSPGMIKSTEHLEAIDPANHTEEDRYIGAGQGYVNLTGFRKGDNFTWDGLKEIQSRWAALHRDASLPLSATEPTWDPRPIPVWQNISGSVTGAWSRTDFPGPRRMMSDYNLSKIVPYVDWQEAEDWVWNLSLSSGGWTRMTFHDFQEKDGASYVSASMAVEDKGSPWEMWDMTLYGVHWGEAGVALLSTNSDKFDGIFGIPLLAPTEDMFLSARKTLNESIIHRMETKDKQLYSDPRHPWVADDYANAYTPTPQCEYIVFLQLLPPDREKFLGDRPKEDAKTVYDEIEQELRDPMGAPIGMIPRLQMAMEVFSPDCGFSLASVAPVVPGPTGHLSGYRSAVQRAHLNSVILGMFTIATVQFTLLRRQMNQASTPSTIGRVSFLTICIMALADWLLAVFALVFILNPRWVVTSAAMIFSALMSSALAATFLVRVFNTQLPNRLRERDISRQAGRAAREESRSRAATPVATTEERGDDQILPTTHRPASRPFIVPSDQDIDAEILEETTATATERGRGTRDDPTHGMTTYNIAHVSRCLLLLGFVIAILLLSTFAQRRAVRALTYYILSFLYFSFWLPQIYRNVWGNSRRALSWEFTLGQSIMRLLPIGYLYAVEGNALLLYTDRKWFLTLCAWVGLQVAILGIQDLFGPRVAIPKGLAWFPEAWNYHPILREDGLESGPLPIGIADAPRRVLPATTGTGTFSPTSSISSATPLIPDSSETPRSRQVIRVMDCAICCEDLEVPVLGKGGGDGGVMGVWMRRGYMVTPCGHVFHTPCLENWMRLRLVCPNCREDIPPL